MQPIKVQEFEVCETSIIRAHGGVEALAEWTVAAIKRVFRMHNDPDRLPARLRRDAGMDELAIERRRIARAPLIR